MMPNPFDSTVELFGRRRSPLIDGIHQKQFAELVSAIKKPTGSLVTLRAPRAGFGKTMLLSRLQESARGACIFLPVRLADGREVDPLIVLEDLLSRLSEELPAGGGLTRLDIITRKLFALALSPLVYSGEVPCQDRDGAYASLRDRPVEAFDFHFEEATIAQWCTQQFDVLAPRLAGELHRQCGAGSSETLFWLQQLHAFATGIPGQGSRLNGVMNAVFNDERHFRTKSNSQESLSALMCLLNLVESVVLVLDEVEGLASNPDAALRAATFLSSLWEANPRLNVILSINDDVWESSFKPRLPMGLRDRFEDTVVRLDYLEEDEARELITARAGRDGEAVWNRISQNKEELYPRALLKEARGLWEKIQANKSGQAQDHQAEPVRAPGPQTGGANFGAETPDFEKPPHAPGQEEPPTRPFFSAPQERETPRGAQPSPFTAEYDPPADDKMSYPPYQTQPAANPPTSAFRGTQEAEEKQTPTSAVGPKPFSPFAEQNEEESRSPFQADEQAEPTSKKEQDTVDDLLRQFRERNHDD